MENLETPSTWKNEETLDMLLVCHKLVQLTIEDTILRVMRDG